MITVPVLVLMALFFYNCDFVLFNRFYYGLKI